MRNELNQSTVSFPKLDALEFPELQALREKMDARSEPEIDILMRSIGIPVTKEKFEFDDGIPIVQDRKAVLYIRAPRPFNGQLTLPKYHISHCKVLKKMQQKGRYHTYYASSRTDGKFLLKLSPTSELSLHELVLCKLCLKELGKKFGWNVFPNDPKKFPLADWLEPFFDYASEGWRQRSHACREKANWECEQCGIDLNNDRRFLVAHHKWGTRFNAPQDLMALCIGCHAEQPGGGHRMLKHYPDYKKFMRKHGNERQLLINSKELDVEIGF